MKEDSFRNRPQALRSVARMLASWLSASELEDLFGYFPDLDDDEFERLDWAVGEVQRRLYKMGGKDQQ